MEEIQIVCGGNGQDIVPRVPFCMKDLPVVIQVVRTHFVTAFSCIGCDFLVSENPSQGGHVP